jgi:hypothetical protein
MPRSFRRPIRSGSGMEGKIYADALEKGRVVH